MIKSNLFRIYNARTYEKVENLDKNYYGDYHIKNDNKNDEVILCSSFKLYDYKNNWIIVFEGDILEVTFKEISKEKDIKLKGTVTYENGFLFLHNITQGKLNLTQSSNIISFEIIDNFFDIENRLYKIKELFDNYFISSSENFKTYIRNNNIVISSDISKFEYIIKEKRMICSLPDKESIDFDNEFQFMLFKGCIDYLGKKVNKIWIDEEMD